MSNPDWTEAPTEATHYDCNADVFCTVDGWWSCKGKYYAMPYQMAWGSYRYTPRPVEPASTAWNGIGWPPVGTVCEVIFSDRWVRATIEHLFTWKGETECIFKTEEDWDFSSCLDCFRPIRTHAHIERETLIRVATQVMSHDNVISERNAAESLYEAGMLKLPEGYRIEG